VANSETYLLVLTPVVTGYRFTPYGERIEIIGDYSTKEFNPNDPRIGAWGGGIHNDLGLLIVQDSTINNNEVKTRLGSFGGGISSFLGAVLITNTPLTLNRSEVTTVLPSGGAIFSFASFVRVADSKLNDNTVKAGLFLSFSPDRRCVLLDQRQHVDNRKLPEQRGDLYKVPSEFFV
jgi:hypothetical protein